MENKRSTYIGGSDVAAILGLSPYKTAVDVWRQKTQDTEELKPLSGPMVFGKMMEDCILSQYLESTGELEAVEKQYFVVHPEYPYLGGTLDAFIPAKKRVIEVKRTIGSDEWGESGTDQIPMAYLVQVAWYAMLTGAIEAHIPVLFKLKDELKVYAYHQKESIETMLKQKMIHFWQEHVLKDLPPVPKTHEDMKILFKGTEQSIVADAIIYNKVLRLKDIKSELSCLEKEEERLKLEIMGFMQEASLLVDDHFEPLVSWKATNPRAIIDVQKLKADGLYNQYTKPSSHTRTFILKG